MNSPEAATQPQRRPSWLSPRVLCLGVLLWNGFADIPGAGLLARESTRDAAKGARGTRTDVPALNRNVTAPDLVLDRKGEQKAEALAAFAEGVAAEDNADIERALDAYRRALALDPSNTELAAKIGMELAQRDQVPEGIDVLKDAAKAAPKDALPPLCLSQIYGKFLQKPELAERYAQTALSLAPDHFATYLALFDLYFSTGQRKKADQILDRAYKAKTDDPDFWLQFAEVTVRLARREHDEAIPEAVLERLETAIARALKRDEGKEPLSTEAVARQVTAGNLYGMLKENAKAIPYYQKALAHAPEMEAEDRINLRNKLARMLLEEKRQEEATAVLEALIREAPTRYDTYELLGEIHESNGEIDRAIASYQQALLVDSTQPERFLKVAELQLQRRKPADAVKTLTEAHARFPAIPRMTYSLAIALAEAKEFQRAMVAFAQALYEAGQRDHSLLDSEFYFRYGAVAEQAGDMETAAKMLRKCIELNPASAAEAYNYLGYMWADKGVHLPEAMELIKRALALDPENGAYLDSLGWCLHRLGNHREALDHLQRAAERLEPEDPVVFEHLGDVYQALGKREEALAQWRKALSLDPENADIRKKLEEAPKTEPSKAEPPAATPSPAPAPAPSPTPAP